jgi:hypothetical protein
LYCNIRGRRPPGVDALYRGKEPGVRSCIATFAAGDHQALTRFIGKIAIAAISTTCDNACMPSFDDIEIRRPAIAQDYLALLQGAWGQVLARSLGSGLVLQHSRQATTRR